MQQEQQPEIRKSVPVKMYQTSDRLVVAAPMPGLQPEDLTVEVTSTGSLVLQAGLRGRLREETFEVQTADLREGHARGRPQDPASSREHWQETKKVILDEWSVGGYYREVDLPTAVDGRLGNASFGNGVLVVSLPLTSRVWPAMLALIPLGEGRGQRVGSAGHPVHALTTAEHRAAQGAFKRS